MKNKGYSERIPITNSRWCSIYCVPEHVNPHVMSLWVLAFYAASDMLRDLIKAIIICFDTNKMDH
jgi:hypothetical protein